MNLQPNDLLMLDTNVLINVVRANDIAARIDAEAGLRARQERPLVSVVTVGEALSLGVHLKWVLPSRRRSTT